MKLTAAEYKELARFLDYPQDKVESCYARETEKAIARFLKDTRKGKIGTECA